MHRKIVLVLAAALLSVALAGCAAISASENRARRLSAAAASEPTATALPAPTAAAPQVPTAPAAPTAAAPEAAMAEAAAAEAAASHLFAAAGSLTWVSRRPPAQRLVIPRLGIDAGVVELGVKRNAQQDLVWETAAFAVGHHQGTANPGDGNNMVMSGHISSLNEGDVFRRLPEIALGDGIIVSTSDKDYLYHVRDIDTVNPDQIHVMDGTNYERLTLITCVPDGIYTQRLIVVATP